MTSFISHCAARLHSPVYRSRLEELVKLILPHLKARDRILDVGCGSGMLGRSLLDAPNAPANITVEGLERMVRGGEPISVHAYDGIMVPFENSTFDVVILADVLHHEEDPERLLKECSRVCRGLLIIKDHQVKGPLAYSRIKLLDWAANAPYGVRCLYRYKTPEQWEEVPKLLAMDLLEECPSMRLYPFPYSIIFGGSLHYFAVLRK